MRLVGLFLLLSLLYVAAYKNEQCQRRTDEQLIWEYDVRRSYRIGAYQEVEAEYGPTGATITCIGVDSLSEENNGAMWVTSGGIGYNFIKIKFRSKYSRGLHYRVYVYGKPHSIRKS
ncbi:PREDICTED: uncharacterized protein LOC108579316 [Habropoda laboriosa]|uniref:uncharacterized protein LOC108579316 n=1 Tax=Habropoda laboriosa TaxID=597456 RepID=UPI00083E683C|nr:PREDICTED: uncharacterized protein LOC108579316 [Habropoda laboriosa]